MNSSSPSPADIEPKVFTVDRLRVAVYSTRNEMGRAAATDAVATITRAIEANGHARVILASAPSQLELLTGLTTSGIDWSKVTIFHMDEYVGLTASHPASFRHFQLQRIVTRVQPAAFHGIQGEAPDLDAECRRYSALLAAAPIDAVCLGIGENGHLAFNDPPVADFSDPQLVKVVELDAACRNQQVHDGCFPDIDTVPRMALTLTIPALLGGAKLFCVVPGPRKAEAIRQTLKGPLSTACPATILRTHPAARLYLDTASASLV